MMDGQEPLGHGDLNEEKYKDVQRGLEMIADKFVWMLPGLLDGVPKPDEKTITVLGKLIENHLQFQDHDTGIDSLSRQVWKFVADPEAVVMDKGLDCKLPPIVLGFAVKKLYESLGIGKKIYFGLGTPVHPHVIIEIEDVNGEVAYMDIDYWTEEAPAKTLSRGEARSARVRTDAAIGITEDPKIDHGYTRVIRPRESPAERVARKSATSRSVCRIRPLVDAETMRMRLTNSRYEHQFFREIGDVDFLRVLDANFLSGKHV